MKNKKLLYVLVPAVIFIWGGLIFKIYSRINPGSKSVVSFQQARDTAYISAERLDTFTILCNYRDPFLNKPLVSAVIKAQPHKGSQPKAPIQAEKWPSIVYCGMIKNLRSSKQLILLQIDGRSITMRSGDVISDIQLKQVFKDSIEVSFRKDRRVIRKVLKE
jgi:hypothetical protein